MLLVEKNEIYIKGYKELLILEENLIKVKMQGYCLNIRGKDLMLNFYDQYEIHLNGTVKVIEYDEYRV